ncbi:MAG: YbhB/YbcL family Raf kinase inhibitor-like protein [Pseudobdellovibrio sp.]
MKQNIFTLKSKAFANQHEIPKQYTCEGRDISPQLEWSGVPEGTKSLVLIVEDPDAPDPKAPKMIFTHWIVYNIPLSQNYLADGAENLSSEVRFGLNDWKRSTWGGPCPPIGKHRYFYKLYAVDTILNFFTVPTKKQIEEAMNNHILGKSELVGLYEKSKLN